jgi:uncharacterized protein (DUF2249 family)
MRVKALSAMRWQSDCVVTESYINLDVREDLSQGREPFSRIMAAVATLKPGQRLRVIAPFEPAPLYAVLKGHGFSHATRPQSDGSVEVMFEQTSGRHYGRSEPLAKGPLKVDARGLEPPEPMVRILEALAVLPRGSTLLAHTDRSPVHLRPHLEDRGFIGESDPQPDGSCLTTIRHA